MSVSRKQWDQSYGRGGHGWCVFANPRLSGPARGRGPADRDRPRIREIRAKAPGHARLTTAWKRDATQPE
jgi:hypothetical protein